MVSICCLVYNHEKYLRQCLDGFLSQETDFKYEVLIHDDASTDGSAEIIREYQKKFPDIIKPIYQSENQYSQKIKISWKYQYPRAKGKYIALCEGDDYWTDPQKLQQQFDMMEKDDSISMCVHAVRYVSENGKPMGKTLPNPIGNNKIISSQDFIHGIMIEKFYPFQTSSYFLRTAVFTNLDYQVPKYFSMSNSSDITTMLLFGYYGNIGYIAKEMSCYRFMSENSWSSKVLIDNEKLAEHRINSIKSLLEYNEYTNHVFSNDISERINKFGFEVRYLRYQYRELKKEPYKKYYKKLSRKRKIYVFAHAKVPFVLRLYHKIKGQNDLDEHVICDR